MNQQNSCGSRPHLFALLVLVGWFVCCARAAAADRPNIVVILADDLGYGDLACYGRLDIRTPNLDRLARQGVRFTQHYANGPECTPTRTAFLTGRYQHWVGGLECAIGLGNVGRYDDAIRLAHQNDLGLPTTELTIARLLKDSGYATAITGKWHLGYERKFAPHLHGFDHTFYCTGGGMDYFHYIDSVAGYNLFANGNPIRREGYFTDLATDEAIAFLRQPRNQPFFLYLPYTAPHTPFQGPDEKQRDPLPLDSPRWNQSQAPPDVYVAMIEHMDKSVARVLTAIDDLDAARNTLVIFTSDNGGTKSARNGPLRGFKGSTFEGGIRVPLIARWPGTLPAGVTSDQPCITFDLTASIAAAAGVSAPRDKPFEGIDILRQVADGMPDIDRELYWRKPRGDSVWMGVRVGALKYVAEQTDDRLQEYFYDLSTDAGEQRDLTNERGSDLQRLKQMYQRWEEETRRNRRGRPEPLAN